MRGKKTKLLMGIPHPNARGGPPTHVPLLVEYFLDHSDYEIKTFFFGSKRFGTERGQRETVLKKMWVTSGKILEYLYYLATFRPHIVHLNTALTNLSIIRDFPFAVVSRIFRVKLIFKLHGSHSDVLHTKSYIQRSMIQLIFWGATKVGVLSEAERQEFVQQFGHSKKLVTTRNIVVFDVPTGGSELLVQEDDEICGLFVSRIEDKKGLRDLLNAIPLITKVIPTFRLIVAGDGPDTRNCIELADRLRLSNRVTWLGHVDNLSVQTLYGQCDVFIFPTHFPEGMPMVLVEALKTGIPIITTKVRFALSYLEECKNCLFIEKRNPDDLAKKVVRLVRDQELQRLMKRENPEILNGFSKANVGREFEEIYEDMLN